MANLNETDAVNINGTLTITGTNEIDNISIVSGTDNYTINGGDEVGEGDSLGGGSGNDTINGGAGDDRISGKGGADIINGGDGADNIRGGGFVEADTTGDLGDTINGGGGNDIIEGQLGNDIISGGEGNDLIDGGEGDDTINGDGGNDIIDPGTGSNTIDGGADDGTGRQDQINYDFDANQVLGISLNAGTYTIKKADGGTDTVTNVENIAFNNYNILFSGSDFIFGDDTDDILTGTTNNNIFVAGAGNDTINTGNGLVIRVFAGQGDDEITLGTGEITVDAGDGTDNVNLGFATNEVTAFSILNGVAKFTTASGEDTLENVETFTFTNTTTTSGTNVLQLAQLTTEFVDLVPGQDIVGTSTDNTIEGTISSENIDARGGNDTIIGSLRDDTIDGGDGTDTVSYTFSIDDIVTATDDGTNSTFAFADYTDTLTNVEHVQFSDATITLNQGNNIFGTTGVDGGLNGDANNNTILGLTGNDTINTGNGNNYVHAGSGDDTITTGTGDDTVDGGAGNDTVNIGVGVDDVTAYQNNNGVYTVTHAQGTDTFSNIESFNFNGEVVAEANMQATFINLTDQTFTSTAGNDNFVGGFGDDTVNFGYALSRLVALTKAGDVFTLVGTEGTDTVTNVENYVFSDQTVLATSFNVGTSAAETMTGTANNDIISGAAGVDTVNAGEGDDTIVGAEAGETIDGGAGTDLVTFGFAASDLTSVTRSVDGTATFTTAGGAITLNNVENVFFAGDSDVSSLDDFVTANSGVPTFSVTDAEGNPFLVTPTVYSGPVSYLEYELLGDENGNVVVGSSSNDFINLLGGDDAANGGDGDDVLDGGIGSNFLTGGNGSDTFFLDGRGGTTTWSTITDFTSADNVNIWGWNEGTSKLLLTQESAGASGFEGATYHYDLNDDGTIDTSITFSGLTTAQVPDSSAEIVAGNGYLLFT